MAYIVQNEDIENTTPQLLSVSGTASTLSNTRLGRARRTFFSIIPITAGVTVTIVLGDSAPVATQGIVLIQNQPFSQSLDNDNLGEPCKGVFQGTIQAIASGAGQVAFVEIFDR